MAVLYDITTDNNQVSWQDNPTTVNYLCIMLIFSVQLVSQQSSWMVEEILLCLNKNLLCKEMLFKFVKMKMLVLVNIFSKLCYVWK